MLLQKVIGRMYLKIKNQEGNNMKQNRPEDEKKQYWSSKGLNDQESEEEISDLPLPAGECTH